jgi:stalled ribosome alternative rescue factor ArfA|tara:strand:- start:29306 stop:29455 length:150 start_codon:yes stop_codon:yes gene_type:complete
MKRKKKKKKIKIIRVIIDFNTGTRVETPKKGKGSYKRNKKHKKKIDPKD